MAKGKKASGTQYTSKGLVGTGRKLRNSIRRERSEGDVFLSKKRAWQAGKRVMLTVPNPDTNNTRERFIRVEATTIWGKPRGRYAMRTIGTTEGD